MDNILYHRMFPNFRPEEFACPCKHPMCQVDGMQFPFLFAIQDLRNQVEFPLPINSGYRCSTFNAVLKGAVPNSNHIKGIACDIGIHKMTSQQKHLLLEKAFNRFTGIGIYKNFIHLDTRPARFRSLWIA